MTDFDAAAYTEVTCKIPVLVERTEELIASGDFAQAVFYMTKVTEIATLVSKYLSTAALNDVTRNVFSAEQIAAADADDLPLNAPGGGLYL